MSISVPNDIRADLTLVISGAREAQSQAYERLMRATDVKVGWAYGVWDDLVAALTSKDNHTRAIAGQLLPNLAKSDSELRLKRDLDKLLDVTHDERFVTARHTLQSLWKVGVDSKDLRQLLLKRLEMRFNIAAGEKNGTLVRYDLLVGLKKLYEATEDAAVAKLARSLIPREADAKYQKKYRTVWKD